MKPIYLDYNSTTPISPTVAQRMALCYEMGYLNPASQHRLGQEARQVLEKLRSEIINMLGGVSTGMRTDRLILTSGGTESNNLAISGLARAARDATGARRIIISAVEHPSVIGVAHYLATQGFEIDTIAVDANGICDLDELAAKLDPGADPPTEANQNSVAAVSIMAANNETGVIQPIQSAAEMCREKGIYFHTDAVQMVGKIDVNFSTLGVDALTFTAHKFHGPRGVGGLLVRNGIELTPLIYGGFQQMGTRPGTEDVALTTGLHQALLEFQQSPERNAKIKQLRDQLETSLLSMVPGAVINGVGASRMSHTINISFPGINRQALLMAADFAGLAISTGSACASGSSDPSHVIIAMGASEEVVEGSIRISLGATTSQQEIDDSLTRFQQVLDRLSTL